MGLDPQETLGCVVSADERGSRSGKSVMAGRHFGGRDIDHVHHSRTRLFGWNRRSSGGIPSNRGMHSALRLLTRGVTGGVLDQSLRRRLVQVLTTCWLAAAGCSTSLPNRPVVAHHALSLQWDLHLGSTDRWPVLTADDRERSFGRTYAPLACVRRLGSNVCSLFRQFDVRFRRPVVRLSTVLPHHLQSCIQTSWELHYIRLSRHAPHKL